MASQFDLQTVAGFYEEAVGYLSPLDECLGKLSSIPGDRELLDEVHRLTHSIRGASAVVGMPQLTTLSGDLESFVEDILSGVLDWEPTTLDIMREAVNLIRLQLELGTVPVELCNLARQPQPAVPMADPEVIEGFLVEAEEALQAVSEQLRAFSTDPENQAALLEVRRAVHTIKGAGGMVGLMTLSSVAHRMEDLLDALADRYLVLDKDILGLLHRSADLLSDLVAAGGSSASVEAAIPDLLDRYRKVMSGAEGETVAEQPLKVQEAEATDSAKFVRVPLERVDELVRIVTELFVHRFSFERTLAKSGHELSELSLSLRRLQQLAATFEQEHVLVQTAVSEPMSNPEFDPLEFDRYTKMYTHSRDLSEATADVDAAQAQLRVISGDFESFLNREKRLTSQLQDRLLRFRMVPLSSIAARLHRTVRVASDQAGKQAELILSGASTDIDKTMLESLSGSLEHLLRNAVAHGIESPEDRAASGKPAIGRIILSADYEGTQVKLRLGDDGAGLHTALIRERGLSAGLIDLNEADALTADDLHRLMFLPGFSTAVELTELAGRGIGLDVVKNTVESLKGRLHIDSVAGQGTSFTIRLPLTLAISRVLIVEVRNRLFAIPIASVREVARLDAQSVEVQDGQRVARLANRVFPLHSLGDMLGIPAPVVATIPSLLPVALLRNGDADFAVSVDRILEAREVVVKPLSNLIGRAPHLIGATMLGDGAIVPILDPAGLVQGTQSVAIEAAPAPKALNIMIVDDSLSVRRVIAGLLERQGWHSAQAKDGVEALDLLRKANSLPDLILMDVEMPRMDGFELTATLRSQDTFRHIPIVMLTSRSGDKHRAKAFSVGVTDYLVKPYQDDHLLHIIRTNSRRLRGLPVS